MRNKISPSPRAPTTHVVSLEILKQVYDSPLPLAAKQGWLAEDDDARTIKTLLAIPENSVSAILRERPLAEPWGNQLVGMSLRP